MNVIVCVLGVIFTIFGIVALFVPMNRDGYARDDDYDLHIKENWKKPLWAPLVIVLGLGLFVFGNSFKIVPTGYTGVRIMFGHISEQGVPQGFNMKTPFVETICLVSNKQQDKTIEDEIWGETTEKTPVYATGTVVTYQISPEKSAWILAHVAGEDNGLIDTTIVASAVKATMVELSADNVTNRTYIEPLAKTKLIEALNEKYGEGVVTVLKVVINNMDFEAAYNDAIAAKSIAQRQLEEQQIKNETAIAKAEADKTVTITNAEAKKQADITQAEAEAQAKLIVAEAEAKANELLSQSLTDPILRARYYEKWDGKLPTVVGSDSSLLLDMGNMSSGTSTTTAPTASNPTPSNENPTP